MTSPEGEAKIAVVKILDPSRIVINRGKADGVREGQRFLVYALGEVIIDPLDGRDLGALEEVRGRGKVIHLQEKMSTIESIEIKQIPQRSPSRLSALAGLAVASYLNEIERYENVPFYHPEIGDLCRPI